MRIRGILGSMFVVSVLTLTFGTRGAFADTTLTATSVGNNEVDTVDLTTNTVTKLFSPPAGGNPDSLIFNGPNEIIYTQVNTGTIAMYNLTTQTNTNFVFGLLQPRDLVLDPSGTTILVSDFGTGNIDRITISNGNIQVLSSFGSNGPDGLAYDASGHLFAVMGRDTIVQLDPTTGAILRQTRIIDSQLDGLTFDPTTGKLWVASENGLLFSVTTDLSTITQYTGPSGTQFDGIAADGLGNMYLANIGKNIYQFNIASSTFTSETAVPGIDDLAPITGSGSNPPPNQVPEPSTLTLLGIGLSGLLGRSFGRRRVTG